MYLNYNIPANMLSTVNIEKSTTMQLFMKQIKKLDIWEIETAFSNVCMFKVWYNDNRYIALERTTVVYLRIIL